MQQVKPPLLLPEPPATLSNDDPVDTKLSEVGRVQAINLTNQNLTNIQLEKLQKWITEQKKAWDKVKKSQ